SGDLLNRDWRRRIRLFWSVAKSQRAAAELRRFEAHLSFRLDRLGVAEGFDVPILCPAINGDRSTAEIELSAGGGDAAMTARAGCPRVIVAAGNGSEGRKVADLFFLVDAIRNSVAVSVAGGKPLAETRRERRF